MSISMILKSPLFTDWQEQHVRLNLAGVKPGAALALTLDGAAAPFQYTGAESRDGAEVLVKLGFAKGQTRRLEFAPAAHATANLARREIPLAAGAAIGAPGRELRIPAPAVLEGGWVAGPFGGFAGYPFQSRFYCEKPFEGAALACVNDGPLFADYELVYRFAEHRHYTLRFRCYKAEPYVEVAEHVALQMNAKLVWTLNPAGLFDHIVSRESFEGETQPEVEPLALERTRDVLCRLQMPVLSEYFIPNNRGWFAFFDSRNEARGMLGVLGLYGAKWEAPVENMPELLGRGGAIEWNAALEGGRRHWLLYAGPVEKAYAKERRLVFHRLHAEFNALRLDEHLDLAGDQVFDATCWNEPGFFVGADFHEQARRRYEAFPCLPKMLSNPGDWLKTNGSMHTAIFACLLQPSRENQQAVCDTLVARFERWVRQFQGWRTAENDYMKNVIGFTRYLRGMLIGYELLRKDGFLTPEQVGMFNAYFVFAARRILDEGRWPHSRTWKHPDHPESSRDLYTYGGEHKPDRLVWTNSLPNFQSDPICGLAHLSAIFRDHPDAAHWQQFALDDLDRQLTAYSGRSGAWEESINYALYTFSYFLITFRPLKYRWGLDYFNDERVRRTMGWLCRFFGPFDKRFGEYAWPGIGNAVIPTHGASYLLAYAGELAEGDPLREDCIAIYQLQQKSLQVSEHYGTVLAAMAPIPERAYALRPTGSEVMDEVGVSLREKPLQPDESYLFQKIGFAKDHYEGDESAFNWYAKGTPFLMDYATYTGDAGRTASHNLVEIPDEDPLRRGYLADHLFSPAVDYTRCEMPVVLKLLWGYVRSFDEIDGKHSAVDRTRTPYFYIGDDNPVGPKTWKVRCLLFVKPDYVAVFDRVYGEVPHRWNLHFTGAPIGCRGGRLEGRGRFDLDLLGLVQHPATFDTENGELVPAPDRYGQGEKNPHRQHWIRLYNRADGVYRTLLFARERGRDVRLEALPGSGMKVVTPEYTDYVFVNNEPLDVRAEGVRFRGASGWIRRRADGQVQACVPDGDFLEAFGMRLTGRGPWTYNLDGRGAVEVRGPTPRCVAVARAG